MNKPLSPQARLSVQQFIDAGGEFGGLMQEVLNEATFWREAVKNCRAEADDGPSSGMCLTCVFCDGQDTSTGIVSGDGVVVHESDCPYKLAQQ